jgi:hypothetical protein
MIALWRNTMHRLALIALVVCAAGGAAACGDDDDSPTSPSNVPVVFSAILSPANEVPPVPNAESSGVGAVQITFNLTRDAAGAITGGTADFYFQASGFPGGTAVQGAHIHPGVPGVNGPVIIGAALSGTNRLAMTNGTVEYRESGIVMSAANAAAVVANPSAFYFNVHSPLNPGGFMRGQLTRIQ